MNVPELPELDGFLSLDVVLDTRGELVYIGKLVKIMDNFYELTDADVHDTSTGRTSKELYIIDAKKFGVKKNRAHVLVRKAEIVSISRLSDVIEY